MLKTERILLKDNHTHFKGASRVCRLTAIISNQVLFYFRQAFFNHESISWQHVDKLMKTKHRDKYDALPNAISQQAVKKIGTEFKAFWQAHKQWKLRPDKFKARPRIPHYQKAKTALQPAQGVSIKSGKLIFPKKMNLAPLTIHCTKDQVVREKSDKAIVKEIRYVPHGSCFWLEIVFDEEKTLTDKQKEKRNVTLNPYNVFSIDLGINNLATLVSNKPDFTPVLFNGKPVKSLNQRFNKQDAYYRSQGLPKMRAKSTVKRFCYLNDYFHKVSRHIIELCLQQDVGRIVIGKNVGWKQEINIGKVNNQKFVSVPFQALIEKITYKATQYNIEVILQEESFTSKADALALDHIPVYGQTKEKPTFSGRRKSRGLYQSSVGKLVNADVNGAINILRKVIGDDFVTSLLDKGAVFAPVRWTPTY